MAVSEQCNSLLIQGHRFAPLYGDRLANHLPMGLIALDKLGATATDLTRFFEKESAKLEPIDSVHAYRKDQVTADEFRELASQCHQDLVRDGVGQVLRSWLPQLAPGIGASAFHALIRLAYAIESENKMEIAFALAYWKIEFLELNLPAERVPHSPMEIAQRLIEPTKVYLTDEGIIVDKMKRIAGCPGLAEERIQPVTLSLDALAHFALIAYSRKDDFTLLHLLTATHAFRQLLPYFVERDLALRYFWQAVLVAFLTTDHSAKLDMQPGQEEFTWRQAKSLAVASPDVHTIKLTYSASCESQVYGQQNYLELVRRRLS